MYVGYVFFTMNPGPINHNSILQFISNCFQWQSNDLWYSELIYFLSISFYDKNIHMKKYMD